MEETLGAKLVHALVFVGICAAIILVGWQEPLRYRFMSVDEIADHQASLHPTPVPQPVKPWQPEGTSLDRFRYGGRSGPPSESGRGSNALRAAPQR